MPDAYNSRIARLVGRLNKSDKYAVTVSNTCTLYSCGPSEVSVSWRRHEDCHKRQIRRAGWLKFMARYIWYSLRYGYRGNPYEAEAERARYGIDPPA